MKSFLLDAFIDLDRAENHADALKDEGLDIYQYEEHFDQFLRYINSAWEKAVYELDEVFEDEFKADSKRKASKKDRVSDPLIHYIKVARDQLSHRRGVLWHSEHGPRPMDAGEAITREGAHAVRDHNRYAAAVLPTLVLDLIPTEAALVPIEERVTEKGKKASLITVPVPVEHDGRPLTATDPTNCALAALKYYGEVLQGWASNYREKYYREKFR